MTQRQHDEAIARYQRETAWAARQLIEAMRAWKAAGIYLGTNQDTAPAPWTPDQRALTHAVANAWRDYARKRDAYAGLIEERGHLYPDAEPAA